jgi:hypothetical protein
MVPGPTLHTSPGALPHTLLSGLVLGLGMLDQAEPCQWMIVPFEEASDPPTAHTSLDALPHTSLSVLVVGLGSGHHSSPCQCRSVPPSPTAHASLWELPHTPWSGLGTNPVLDHAEPCQ